MYVIDETDLECHGFELTGEYDWISNDQNGNGLCFSDGTDDSTG